MRIILSTPTGCSFFHWRVCWVCFVKVKSLKDFANIGWLQKVWSFFYRLRSTLGDKIAERYAKILKKKQKQWLRMRRDFILKTEGRSNFLSH